MHNKNLTGCGHAYWNLCGKCSYHLGINDFAFLFVLVLAQLYAQTQSSRMVIFILKMTRLRESNCLSTLNRLAEWCTFFSFTVFSLNFNPTITHEDAYSFGETYSVLFFVASVALAVYLAALIKFVERGNKIQTKMHNNPLNRMAIPLRDSAAGYLNVRL